MKLHSIEKHLILLLGMLVGGILASIDCADRVRLLRMWNEERLYSKYWMDTRSAIINCDWALKDSEKRKELGLEKTVRKILSGEKALICTAPSDSSLLDGWGQPIRARFEPKNESLILWSVGPNGIDEDGKGDDICRSFWGGELWEGIKKEK